MPPDAFDLARFVDAQVPVYAQVQAELATGRKRSHWMWFVFPQLAGLGRSAMAQRYAIGSREEAVAYLAHPLLCARLRECSALVLSAPGPAIDDILGPPDDLKFRSCMTLFDAVAPAGETLFAQCLKRFFGGERDPATLARLG
ncbi:uncharacterized protein (DUF1810 family) [Pseudacidovorax intermedius]|uniref:Uncharacterized protein (DUF1810 family) n=1 Tax=Pseudacidovorax intermedius TaxID=433924 RepID=A0A370FIL1_9BURK|nr:DUF1810 domain-containing protein [Pseudacidovorax intermedius]RDI27001.1 uncharacterized protein (DUF1810 family) [Pseudacidovorax intermedius]